MDENGEGKREKLYCESFYLCALLGALLSTKASSSCAALDCTMRKHRMKVRSTVDICKRATSEPISICQFNGCVLCKCENSALHNSHSILEFVHVIRCGRNRCTLHLLQTSCSCTPKWADGTIIVHEVEKYRRLQLK